MPPEHGRPGERLAALASALLAADGVWMSVRPRPFGRGALARFWTPHKTAADAFVAEIPSSWETHVVGHLRTYDAVTYDGYQISVTVPLGEVRAAQELLRRRALPPGDGRALPQGDGRGLPRG